MGISLDVRMLIIVYTKVVRNAKLQDEQATPLSGRSILAKREKLRGYAFATSVVIPNENSKCLNVGLQIG